VGGVALADVAFGDVAVQDAAEMLDEGGWRVAAGSEPQGRPERGLGGAVGIAGGLGDQLGDVEDLSDAWAVAGSEELDIGGVARPGAGQDGEVDGGAVGQKTLQLGAGIDEGIGGFGLSAHGSSPHWGLARAWLCAGFADTYNSTPIGEAGQVCREGRPGGRGT